MMFRDVDNLYKRRLDEIAEEMKKDFEEDKKVNDRVNRHIFVPLIDKIYVNEKKGVIVVKWETGETTKVEVQDGDTFDLEKGISIAITKYVLGNNYNAGYIFNSILKKVVKQ